MPLATRGHSAAGGQALALFALSITMLLGMASLAIDVGRLLSEQRYLQNAADASALAGAQAAVIVARSGSGTIAQVRTAASNILAENLDASPAGVAPKAVPLVPVFAGGLATRDLVDGIIFTDAAGTILPDTYSVTKIAHIRTAARSRVEFMLGRAIGVDAGWVQGRAHVGLKASANLVPIAVRRFVGGTGPNTPVPASCPEDPASARGLFFDLAASWETACFSSIDPFNPYAYNRRTEASPDHPGPITELVGQGAQANGGGVSFRGFVNLDVRAFLTTIHRYYNGITAETNLNSVKRQEAGWVGGYPGPALGTVVLPSDGSNQVGIMDGNSAGLIVSAMSDRFGPDDVILAALYDGNVKTIPAFLLREDVALPALTAGQPPLASTGKYTVEPNKAFNDQVQLSVVGRPAWLSASVQATAFAPQYPQGTSVTLTNVSAPAGTPTQIDSFWLKGTDTNQPNNLNAPDYYLPIAVQVGDLAGKDFAWVPRTPTLTSTTSGSTVTLTMTFSTSNGSNFTNGNEVHIELAETRASTRGAPIAETLPSGTFWFGSTPGTTATNVRLATSTSTVVQKGKNGKSDVTRSSYTGQVTLSIDTSLLTATTGRTTMTIPVEMTATTTEGRTIRHLDTLHVNLSAESTDRNYVEILGFAVYRVTNIDANTVWGRIISPIRLSPDDPELMAALSPRLIPW